MFIVGFLSSRVKARSHKSRPGLFFSCRDPNHAGPRRLSLVYVYDYASPDNAELCDECGTWRFLQHLAEVGPDLGPQLVRLLWHRPRVSLGGHSPEEAWCRLACIVRSAHKRRGRKRRPTPPAQTSKTRPPYRSKKLADDTPSDCLPRQLNAYLRYGGLSRTERHQAISELRSCGQCRLRRLVKALRPPRARSVAAFCAGEADDPDQADETLHKWRKSLRLWHCKLCGWRGLGVYARCPVCDDRRLETQDLA